MKEELLNFCKEKNILLDGTVMDRFVESGDLYSVKIVIEKFSNLLEKKFITKDLIIQNKESIFRLIKEVSIGKEGLFSDFIEFFELSNIERENQEVKEEKKEAMVKINSSLIRPGRSLEVKDFVTHFQNRYKSMANILQDRNELENLTSIGKISPDKQKISVIGMVVSKQQTKNENIILEIEDLTGRMKVLISSQKEDLIKEAEDITLDSVLGFKGLGNGEILFVNEVVFPETRLFDRKKSPNEEYVLFLGDLHYGSHNFLSVSFDKFIDYLNGEIPNTPEVDKIKYIFIVGDLVTGIGNYPSQENDLIVGDLEEQFIEVANLLKKIPKHIKIIISPGNHDCVRLMEPQPILDEKYAWPLYDMENVIVTENPAIVNIGSAGTFPGFNVLSYHGFSFPYYANNISKLMLAKAMNDPIRIMRYLLKNRHLAPTHASTQYFPSEKDPLFIRQAPDIFVSGHTHKSGIIHDNNVLVVSVSTWEGLTPYQEKFGNKPDHCKVPMLNLKTRAIKMLDFETEQEGVKLYSEEEEE